jgi:hypothetical protein
MLGLKRRPTPSEVAFRATLVFTTTLMEAFLQRGENMSPKGLEAMKAEVWKALCRDVQAHAYDSWIPLLFGQTVPVISKAPTVAATETGTRKRKLTVQIPQTPYESVTDPLLAEMEDLYARTLSVDVTLVRVKK